MTCPTGNLHLISARLCNVGALMSETARLKLRQHSPKSSTPTTGHGISILCASSRLKISSTTAEWDKFSKIVSHILQKCSFSAFFAQKLLFCTLFYPQTTLFLPKQNHKLPQLPHLSACSLSDYPLIQLSQHRRRAPRLMGAWTHGYLGARTHERPPHLPLTADIDATAAPSVLPLCP